MSDPTQPTEPPQPSDPGAIRFIFEYSGDRITLIGQHRVDVAVPGVDLPSQLSPGHFVEVRSADGAALARVPVREDISGAAEVFPEDHSEPITRLDKPVAEGAFTVVVPAPSTAHSVAVLRVAAQEPATPPPPGAEPRLAAPELTPTELASFPIDQGM